MSRFVVLACLMATVVSGQITFAPDTAKAHKTDTYRASGGGPTPLRILRRHAPFSVTVKGATPTTAYSLELPGSPSETVPLTAQAAAGGATLTHTQGALGLFNLVAKTTPPVSTPVYFIANPYHANDETYIGTPVSGELFPPELAEHVENEKGALWQGSSRSNSWIPWAFNQYDESVVQTVAELLAPMTVKQRASTALIVRWLTTQSGQVLRGRWDGQYSDGKQPGYWASTTQIVSQYRQTKSVVKYGQCWVFAGLLTSFCRSFGIPSRPLTNFDSAHEHQTPTKPFDQVCHTYYKKTATGGYERVDADNSIWNFHVWVDAWMKRPDITNTKVVPHGWQAIDATPQEQSKGPEERPFSDLQYRCGPASLEMIKAMEVKGNYDVAFVAGEANCLKVDYVDGKEVSRDPNTVGENIFTKMPDSKCNGEQLSSTGYTRVCSQNLARSYSKAGSFLQIAQMVRARQFNVEVHPETVKLGHDFRIRISPNEFKGEADYTIVLSASSYNSAFNFGVLKTQTGSTTKGAELSVSRADWGKDFIKKYVPSKTNTFDVLIVAKPKGAHAALAPFVKRVMIPIASPRLALLCGKKQRQFKPNQVVACAVQFYNPLPYPITNAVMSFSITGQGSEQEKAVTGDLQKQSAKLTLEPTQTESSDVASTVTDAERVDPKERQIFKAKFPLHGATGTQFIVAKLSSDQLDGVSGVMEITITDKPSTPSHGHA